MIRTFRKLAELLDRRERRQALALLALMLAMGLVEVAGVASILPLIAVLADPGIVRTNEYLKTLYDLAGFSDTNSFLILLSAAVFTLVVVRTGLAAFSSYAVLRYAHMRGHAISARLLSSYLRRKYEWFLTRHSADIGRAVLSEVDQVITSSLMPALHLVSQAIIAACLVALVVAVEPEVALVATATIGVAYGLVYFSIRGLLLRIGKERLDANRERFQIAQEVLGGVKEVKIGGLERGYLRRFASASLQHARRRTTQLVLSEIPRNFLEVIAIGGMLVVIIALLLRNDGRLETALPVIALYAFAGLRLLPVVQNLYRSVVSLRSGQPALDALHGDLFEPVPISDLRDDQPPLALTESIELKGVSFSYPQADRLTLKDIDLTIRAHTTVGFVGSTGAGKSTVIDLILGLLEPRQGQLLVDGRPIGEDNVRAWQKSLGYVPQQIFLADESVAANIAFGVPPGQIDMAAVEQAARMAMLHDFITGEMPQGYMTPIGERGVRLSGGQRQRVGIARALYHDPDVLVLDEATSALDNLTERAVMEAVGHLAHRKTILIIAHRLTTVRGCDSIVLMQAGQISAIGTYEELVGTSPEFRGIAGTA